MKKIIIFLATIVPLELHARRVSEWSGYGDEGYVGGFGSDELQGLLAGILLGIFVQRLIEKKMDIDEGWLHTILMSFWIVTPLSLGFIAFVFY